MRYPIVPAVIPRSNEALRKECERLAFSREFHLDLVDGQFVPTTSWPYEPSGEPRAMKHALDAFTLEVDLMVAEPLSAATAWIEAGADMLVFHVETISLEHFREFVEATDVSVGISAHGDTTTETLKEYAAHADYVQVMGIYEIGAQGQPFYAPALERISALKQAFPDTMVSVDGSVNADTIADIQAAGADRFVVGSAIVLQSDPEAAHSALQALIHE
jgi:ribulose-phosphate 3-epimerase